MSVSYSPFSQRKNETGILIESRGEARPWFVESVGKNPQCGTEGPARENGLDRVLKRRSHMLKLQLGATLGEAPEP